MSTLRMQLCTTAALALALAAPLWAQIPGIKVTTDTSVDCSSFKTIARDVTRGLKTDEAKAIACWYFVRRMMYHWPDASGAPSREIDWINSSGYGLCGAQSMTFVKLCQAAGLKAGRRWMPSHVTAEVFYKGGWHFFDCQVGWFAYRKDKSCVAGVEEMAKDPTIITKAPVNGNGSKPFMQCRDVYYKNGRAVEWVTKCKGLGKGRDKPVGKLAIPDLTLLPGMTYTRCWYRETDPKTGKPNRSLYGSSRASRHGCPPAYEKDDPVNYPFWQPYMVDGDGNAPQRTYGNGRLVFSPDLTSDAFTRDLDPGALGGLTVKARGAEGPNLRPAKAGQAGAVVFRVRCPYFFMGDAWLDGEFVRATAGDANSVSVSTDDGKTWKPVWTNDKTGTNKLEHLSLKKAIWGRYRGRPEYLVKIWLLGKDKATDAGLNRLTLTHVFVNNIYSLPYLAPGRNTVRVEAGTGAKIGGNTLKVTYCWWKQGEPRKDIMVAEEVPKLPFEFEIDVKGKELPRMRYVKVELAPKK